jgi:NRAMP (natural resistance-associated macrophage protein)-like metal ion transporter
MHVTATGGDLGEADISPPKVTGVVRDPQGKVEEIVVHKGLLFKKDLTVPADRIQAVEQAGEKHADGDVLIEANTEEVEALSATGAEQLEDKQQSGPIDEVESAIPTAEGLRGKEEEVQALRRHRSSAKENHAATATNIPSHKPSPGGFRYVVGLLGPGFLGGMAGNDSSAVGSYAIDGAQNGFGHLWLLLLATPLYYTVLFTCAKIGRITQKGLADLLREHYGRPVAGLAALLLSISNIALIAADLAAVGSGFELLTGLAWFWFVIPIAAVLWYFTVYRNFGTLKNIFLVLSLAFGAYIITAIWAKPDWSAVLFNTVVPHIDLTFASVSSAVALLGATISPYNIFWQVQGEKEEVRSGTPKEQMRLLKLDMGVGVIGGNLVAYAIILSTATTLFGHHKSIATAADAAQALAPLLGPLAKYLFAFGLIGAGLVAIPVLLAGASYAVAGTLGWPMGLSKKPWQNEGFYLILTVALVVSLMLALLRIDPLRLIFWSNVLAGVLSPLLIITLILVGTNRAIMGKQRLSVLTIIGLVLTFLVMAAAAALLFYGLAMGQSS